MKLSVMAACLFLLASSSIAQERRSSGDLHEAFDVKSGELLEVELRDGGTIEIEGWDKERVEVEILFRRGEAKGEADDFKFKIKKTTAGVSVTGRLRQRHRQDIIPFTVRVMVPKSFDLDLNTAGGAIALKGISGEIIGRTAGGSLDLTKLSGYIDMKTGGGSVALTDSKLDGNVVTGGGSVLVEDVTGDVEARSGGGNVVYRNVKTPDKVYPAKLVHIRNAGGRIDVQQAPHGADVKTGGGDIEIRSANELVLAKTGGGNIYVDRLDGWIEAATGAGDIEVTLVDENNEEKHDVTLKTGSGDITLVIPADLSVEFDIEMDYTKGHRRAKIISDFDLREDEDDEWDYHRGSTRKTLYAEGSFNGGRNRIKIRGVNGVVRIEKR